MIKTGKKWLRPEIKRAQELIEEGHASDWIAALLNAKFNNNRTARAVEQKLWKIEKEKKNTKCTVKVGQISDLHMKSSPEARKCYEAIAYLNELLSEEYHKLTQLQS